MWLIPDFTTNESVMIFKMHHVLGDGMSLMLLLGFLQDKYHHSQYLQTTSVLTPLKKTVLWLLRPITAMYALGCFLVWPTDHNYIKGSVVNIVGCK